VQAVLAAVNDVDASGVVGVDDVLLGDTDGEVVVPVAVEVSAGERGSEGVSGLYPTGDVTGLAEDLVAVGGDADAAESIEHVDGATGREAPVCLARRADDEVVFAVVVEVTSGGGARAGYRQGGQRERREQDGGEDADGGMSGHWGLLLEGSAECTERPIASVAPHLPTSRDLSKRQEAIGFERAESTAAVGRRTCAHRAAY
jgi:hypothetical protein